MKTNILKKLLNIFKRLKRYFIVIVGVMKWISPYLKPLFQTIIGAMKRFGFYLKPLFQKFSELPKNVSPKHYRFFVLSNYSYIFAFIGNTVALFLSALIGAWYIALFCLGSVLFYTLAIRLNLWGYLRVSLPFVILQGLALVILVAYMLGNIGTNALLIPLAMFIFFSPLEYKVINIMVSVAIGAVYAALNYYVRNFTPVIVLSPLVLKIFSFVASCATITAACFIGYYYRTAAVRAEEALEEEYQRAESLLHNILPETIANRLKLKPDTIADGFDGTTILGISQK